MLESIYRSAGFRVGLFTSPHLVSFRERIQVNRKLISEGDVVRLLEEIRPQFAKFTEGNHPTFFETITVMALQYFVEQHCDLVIWETGLGGRLDATNIVTPLASVITNIQYDHQKWLGETLASIAREKAGIIKPGVPVITAATESAALDVIVATARECGAPLIKVDPYKLQVGQSGSADVLLSGDHQRTNAAVALAIIDALQESLPVSEAAMRLGLASVDWPGRLQLVTRSHGRRILLDGAHNPAGAESLATALKRNFSDTKPTLIIGILQDKDWSAICNKLAPLASRILAVRVQNERSASPDELAEACQRANPLVHIRACSGLHEALVSAAEDPFVVVTGSLYLVGEAMESLGLAPVTPHDERVLNEWGGGKAPETGTPP
jgi:dihydrofolate synthase/folylpolyglutamate synthase